MTNPINVDLAIIGAGAAGLMAAIAAGRTAPGARVVAMDGAARIGAKILIAGGGRCNVTHEAVRPDDFHGSSRNAIAKVLRSFPVPETVAFFREIGVALKREETGKLFPVTDRAATVLEALLRAAADAGAEVLASRRVTGVERAGDGFRVSTQDGSLLARRVVIATGGRSVPKTGSDGAGYGMAAALGHTILEPFPALVPLLLPSGHWMTALRGLSAEVELRVENASGKRIERARGAMLFTHFGLSGPAVLDVSRSWIAARRSGPVALVASFAPGSSPEQIERDIVKAAKENPRMEIGTLLRRWVPERLASALVRDGASADAAVPLGRLEREPRRRVARALTALELPVTRERGWDFAEVTAGGVPLSEIHLATMESRLVPGFHLCGEICDVDGRIGGFNFQWAWASGKAAGEGAGRGLHECGT